MLNLIIFPLQSYRKGECVNAKLHGMNARFNITQLEKLMNSGVPNLPTYTIDRQVQNFHTFKYIGLGNFQLLIVGHCNTDVIGYCTKCTFAYSYNKDNKHNQALC